MTDPTTRPTPGPLHFATLRAAVCVACEHLTSAGCCALLADRPCGLPCLLRHASATCPDEPPRWGPEDRCRYRVGDWCNARERAATDRTCETCAVRMRGAQPIEEAPDEDDETH